MSQMPHRHPPDEESYIRWSHIFQGTWTGAPSTPTSRGNMCDSPTVMLMHPGSNSVLGGFESPEEAALYVETFGGAWKIVDRRPEDQPEPGM